MRVSSTSTPTTRRGCPLRPGRAQLRTLAALLCPDATNDIAPLAIGARPPRLAVEASEAGFGGKA